VSGKTLRATALLIVGGMLLGGGVLVAPVAAQAQVQTQAYDTRPPPPAATGYRWGVAYTSLERKGIPTGGPAASG